MYNYRLVNNHGKTLGMITLETRMLEHQAIGGEKLILSAAYVESSENFIEFVVSPDPDVEQMPHTHQPHNGNWITVRAKDGSFMAIPDPRGYGA